MREDRTQQRYEQMLASSKTAAVCVGTDNRILSWNKAAEELFGHRAEHAIGRALSIIIPHRLRAAHDAGFARAVQAGHARLTQRSVDILALHADGTEIPVDLSLSMWFEDGKPMFGALLRDIADRHTTKQRLEHLAHFDTLTSLPNRNAFQERLASEIIRAPCSLLLLDLDEFKYVNDTLGHSVGDKLLAALGARLTAAVANNGFVARLGGDEFAILLSNCADPVEIDRLTSAIFSAFVLPFELGGQSIYMRTTIGIALSPNDASDMEQLLSCADLALYSAKSDGGGTRKFFAREMMSKSEQRHRMGSELRRALKNDEFEIWYQPQVCLATGSLSGVEALLRWRHPDHGILIPTSFISVLEESAIAEEVGDWVVERACLAVAEWERRGLGTLRVGINLFAAQLRSGRLFESVVSALTKHGVRPAQIELEITETTVLRHSNQSTNALRKLRLLGVGVAFDDFGTGFASLSLLQKYPLTRLKIDRSFVAQISRKAGDAAIVKAIIIMAAGLGLKVIAEGVETAEQEVALMTLGCDEAQGYRYGRPMPAAQIIDQYLAKPMPFDFYKSNARPANALMSDEAPKLSARP